MSFSEKLIGLLFKNKAQALVDKLRAEPDMAAAIKAREEATIRLKISTEKLQKSQAAYDKIKKEERDKKAKQLNQKDSRPHNKNISGKKTVKKENDRDVRDDKIVEANEPGDLKTEQKESVALHEHVIKTRMKEESQMQNKSENVFLSKAYWLIMMSVADGDVDPNDEEELLKILAKDLPKYGPEKLEQLCDRAQQIVNKDIKSKTTGEGLKERAQEILEGLSLEEEEQFFADLESFAAVNKSQRLKKSVLLLTYSDYRVKKLFSGANVPDEQSQDPGEDPNQYPGDTTLHLLYGLNLIIAHHGITAKQISEREVAAIVNDTVQWMNVEEKDRKKVMNEAKHWFNEIKDDVISAQAVMAQLKFVLPSNGLELAIVDLFAAAKIDGKYIDMPQRKALIEKLAQIAKIKIHYNGVSTGVHLVGKRAMADFEGSLNVETGKPAKDKLSSQKDFARKENVKEVEAMGNLDEVIDEIAASDRIALIQSFLAQIVNQQPDFKPAKSKTYGQENIGSGCMFSIGVLKDKIGVEFVSQGKLPASKVMNFVKTTVIDLKKTFGKYEIIAGPGAKIRTTSASMDTFRLLVIRI